MATFISFDSLQNSLFNSIFCFQKKFSNLSKYTGTFLQVTIDLGFHFKNCTHVLEYFRFYLLTAVYTKNDTRIFFFYFLSYSDQSKFLFLQTVQSRHNILFTNEPFLHKILASFFSSNMSVYIEKNSVEKLCKVLEMELKTYIPVDPKFVFEIIRFKVLYYIQHDFIRQRLGLSKNQTSMFKSFVIK